MILMVGDDTTRIGIRVKCWRNQRYAHDWKNIYLIIRPGQLDPGANCCHVPGSPWIVWGCWPGHRTGVDLMNPPKPEFPPFFIKASELAEEVLVFELPEHWRRVARYGRHTGIIRYQPMRNLEWPDGVGQFVPSYKPHPEPVAPCDCCGPMHPPHPPMPPRLPACDLVVFDIDYGPRCTLNHIIDRVDVEIDDVAIQ